MSIAEMWQRAFLIELDRVSADEKLTTREHVDAASSVADLAIEAYRARLGTNRFAVSP